MDNQSNSTWPEGMTTLSECMAIASERGYAVEFSVTELGLQATGGGHIYRPKDTRIENFYRFEGISNPDDMAILYVIQTSDGTKGTLVDAYGTYSDTRINDFIRAVQDIHKAEM